MTSSIDVFTKLHDLDYWNDKQNDKLDGTSIYRKTLREFFDKYEIKTVCDIGVAEFSYLYAVDWTDIDYVGVDCVEEKIRENVAKYKKPYINFYHRDVIAFPETLVPADVYLLKHTIQHWPTDTIVSTLPKLLQKCKFMLITNNITQKDDNEDTTLGQFRGLNPTMYPLNMFDPILLSESATDDYDKHIQTVLIKGSLDTDFHMYVSPNNAGHCPPADR